jgi:hypothetical protein
MMMRNASPLIAITIAIAAFAQEPESFEIEPPVLVPNRTEIVAAEANQDARPQEVDLAKLEQDLERAKRTAADSDHLYRTGVISEVELEQRRLRVARLQAELTSARLTRTKQQAAAASSPTVDAEAASEASAKAEVARLTEAAQVAAENFHRLEIQFAEANLQRQLRLLALGSARKTDVSRAEQQLAKVKAQQN